MIVETIRRFFDAHDPGHRPIVAAVSGGVDSTALLVALVEVGDLEVAAAHVNHHLRDSESDDDEAYVRELCARYDIPLRVADGTLDPEAIRHRGIEAAARDVRHFCLHEIAGDALIATAHQKNDQAETVLMRLMTGGGIAALRGIHPVRDDGVIRPLLDVTRTEIESFLTERDITPRFDRTNADQRFLRNRVRAMLRGFDVSVIDNLAAVARQARQQWPVLERAIDDAEDVIASDDETRFRSMPDDAWLRQALLLRHIRRLDGDARDVSTADLERLGDQVAGLPGCRVAETPRSEVGGVRWCRVAELKRVSVTKSVELLRDGTALVLRRRPAINTAPQFELEIEAGDYAHVPEINATIHIRPASPGGETLQRTSSGNLEYSRDHATAKRRDRNTQLIQIPRHSLPRFTIRNRRPGDRFRPLGMPHDKKVKDLLIDRKIDAALRDRIPLVLWQGTIAWVAGVEVSELFKVTGEAADLYEVAIEKDHESLQRP